MSKATINNYKTSLTFFHVSCILVNSLKYDKLLLIYFRLNVVIIRNI